jgi:hypothetical protein
VLTVSEAWVEILVTYDPTEAEIVKDLLESGDIPVIVRSSKVTPYPVNIGKIGEVKVMVRDQDKDAAEELVKERDYQWTADDNEQDRQ